MRKRRGIQRHARYRRAVCWGFVLACGLVPWLAWAETYQCPDEHGVIVWRTVPCGVPSPAPAPQASFQLNPISWHVTCGKLWEGTAKGESATFVGPLGKSLQIPIVEVSITINPSDRQLFTDNDKTKKILDFVKDRSEAYCRKEINAGRVTLPQFPETYLIHINSQSGGGAAVAFQGQESTGERRKITNWVIRQNSLGSSWKEEQEAHRRQEEARQQEEIKRQRIAQAKAAVRSSFVSKFGVQNLVNEQTLTTNPFIYKGTVVGVHTGFRRMLSANEALFHRDDMGRTAIFVTGVPSTQFSAERTVVLALKVLGTKAIKVGGGELTLPYGEYVGVLECRDSSCEEFYD